MTMRRQSARSGRRTKYGCHNYLSQTIFFSFFQTKNGTYGIDESPLARDLNYTHYYKVWSNLIITTIIPITVMAFCNSTIFLQLRKSRKEMLSARQTPHPLTPPNSNDTPPNPQENENTPLSSNGRGNHNHIGTLAKDWT